MSLYTSSPVVLYMYFKDFGLAIISLSLLTYALLSHKLMMFFVIFNWNNSAYVLMNSSDAKDAYTSER